MNSGYQIYETNSLYLRLLLPKSATFYHLALIILHAQQSSCRKENWVFPFLQWNSLLKIKPIESITFCESWWHPSLIDGLNHRKMEEVQVHQRRTVPNQIHGLETNLKASSQVPAHKDENVAPNSPHMFQTKFYEWKMDLLLSCSLLAQPTQFQMNPPPSSSISSVWSKIKQGDAPTEPLDFSLPKEQAHEVEGNICWKLRCWNTFFSRKMKEERIMWNEAAQFFSFMLRELPKEKFLSSKSETWVVFQMFSFIYDSCLHLMSNVFSLKSGIATGWSNRCTTLMILKNKNTSVCSSSFGLWGPSVQACGNFIKTWSPNLFIVDLFIYLDARALVLHDNAYRKF